MPLQPLTSGVLDAARLEALVAFPAGIKQAYSQWKVGSTLIDDKDVTIVQGSNPNSGLLPVNFYFDSTTGLLVRVVRWNETPVGPNPTQIDYDDYRDVAGVKMPHTWTVSLTYMQMTIKLDSLQANVPVDAARFARPAPVARRGVPSLVSAESWIIRHRRLMKRVPAFLIAALLACAATSRRNGRHFMRHESGAVGGQHRPRWVPFLSVQNRGGAVYRLKRRWTSPVSGGRWPATRMGAG